MSEQIREQVSAFLDGELPSTETELLLKRLTRDGELRESFGRYALIGEALRGGGQTLLTKGFASRVNLTIDGEPAPAAAATVPGQAARWWRPFAGVAVVAGVAAVAIVAMQQRYETPGIGAPGIGAPGVGAPGVGAPRVAITAQAITNAPAAMSAAPMLAANREAISYTVPATPATAPIAAPSGRLTNYMFAHSKYSYGLAQRGVLADLLINDEDPAAAARPPVQQVPVLVAP
jgi:sigma-E factor negative regulatory protein RseA